MYFFVRYGLAAILLVGWLLFQIIIKKRRLVDLRDDALAIVFFVAVWIGVAYLFMG